MGGGQIGNSQPSYHEQNKGNWQGPEREFLMNALEPHSVCAFHTRMVMNMLRILAKKNIQLTRKIEHLAKRTTREKVLSFLSTQATLAKNAAVEFPFNRQELADYLCVDRSALSRELRAVQAEGLPQYSRRHVTLLQAHPQGPLP